MEAKEIQRAKDVRNAWLLILFGLPLLILFPIGATMICWGVKVLASG